MKAVYEMPKVVFVAFASNAAIAAGGTGACYPVTSSGDDGSKESSQLFESWNTAGAFGSTEEYITSIWNGTTSAYDKHGGDGKPELQYPTAYKKKPKYHNS